MGTPIVCCHLRRNPPDPRMSWYHCTACLPNPRGQRMPARGTDLDSEHLDVGKPVGLTVYNCFGAPPQPPSDPVKCAPSAQISGMCESELVQWSCHIAGGWTRRFTPGPTVSAMVGHATGD